MPRRTPPLWLAGCFGGALLLYLAFLPRFLLFASPPTGDQPYYLLDVASLVQDGDLNIKNNYDQHDEAKFYALAPHPPDFVGMTAPDPLPRQIADSMARPPSEEYAAHLPGLAILLAPAWWLGSFAALWWPATIVMMCLLGALLATNAFLLAHEITGRPRIALAVWAAIAFSNPLWTYSYLIFTELATGLLLIYAFRRLARGWADNGPGRLVLIGACIGYMPWLAWRCVLIAVPLALYAAVQWWRAERGAPPPAAASRRARWRRVLPAAWVVLPILAGAAALGAFNLFRFGTLVPIDTQARGQAEVFYWPWDGTAALTRFLNHAFGLLFDIQWGLLIYAPVYLLAAVGGLVMLRSGRPADRRLLAALLGCGAVYWFVIMAYRDWTGEWCPPARYPLTFVPLLAAPLALSLGAARNWLYRAFFALLAVGGFIPMAVMLYRPIRMWPFGNGRLFYGGVFDWWARWPTAPVHFDLTRVLPSFVTPDELQQPVASGAMIAAAFLLVCLGLLLVRRPGPAGPPRRWSRATPILVWAGTATALGAGWLNINADYLRPRMVVEEQQRWTLPHPLAEAHGIAYQAGKIYIASLGPRSATGEIQAGAGELGALDLTTGVYMPVPALSGGGVLPYTYPGDVKAGPDGTLYLLNNGPGTQAVYVLQPDGQVVRRLALEGRLPLGEGLAFDQNNAIYATDMGVIRRYGPDGGVPQAEWGGRDNGFINVMGLAITPEGQIYAAESSHKRVQVLDRQGQFVTLHDVGCPPYQVAIQGDWVDLVCDQGLRAIDWRTGEIRRAQFAAGDPPLKSPTALAYGPDGTLYVLDTDAVISYQVRH